LVNEKKQQHFILMTTVATATAATGLFLIFTLFTAPLFSIISFAPPVEVVGGGFTQQVVVDGGDDNNPYHYLMQQAYAQDGEPEVQDQEEVPEEDEGGGTAEPSPTTTEEEEEEEEQPPPPPPPLTASMNIDSTNGDTAPATFLFETFPEGGTEPYTFSWNFGDGSSQSNEQNTEHTFVNPGTYVVSLTVTDSAGETVSDREEVNVRPGAGATTTTTGEEPQPSPTNATTNATATAVTTTDGGGVQSACGPTIIPTTGGAGPTTTNSTLNQGIDQNATNQTGGEAGLAVNDPGAPGPKDKPTKREGGNQSAASEALLHIEQACMTLQANNDIEGALIELNLAVNALVSSSGNVTTTTGGGAAEGGGRSPNSSKSN
jgi:PKD repeat protein